MKNKKTHRLHMGMDSTSLTDCGLVKLVPIRTDEFIVHVSFEEKKILVLVDKELLVDGGIDIHYDPDTFSYYNNLGEKITVIKTFTELKKSRTKTMQLDRGRLTIGDISLDNKIWRNIKITTE